MISKRTYNNVYERETFRLEKQDKKKRWIPVMLYGYPFEFDSLEQLVTKVKSEEAYRAIKIPKKTRIVRIVAVEKSHIVVTKNLVVV